MPMPMLIPGRGARAGFKFPASRPGVRTPHEPTSTPRGWIYVCGWEFLKMPLIRPVSTVENFPQALLRQHESS